MSSPYRIPDEVSGKERPNAELVYVARDQEKHVGPARTAIQIAIAGVVAGTVAAAFGFPQLGTAIFAGAVLFGIRRWRRAPDVGGVVLRVDAGVLAILDRRSKKVIVRARLADLDDVSLDTKSIRKVTPGQDAVPATRFIDSQVGPEIDVARIAVQTSARPAPFHLTDAFLSHADTVEWLGKIRVFLRAHGWLPLDERDAGVDEDEDEGESEGEDAAPGKTEPR